tara:strand:- start:483 stop:1403 length:921 start_codon:yes stop_codon:yes gene_type:complete
MNFFYESISLETLAVGLAILIVLMGINEIARRYKTLAIILFIALPVFLTFFVWPNTAVPGSSVGSWFDWAKVYSSLAGALGFMVIRYMKNAANNKYLLLFPALILAINIMEAVIRDFEVYSIHGFTDGMMLNGGSWNIMNGIAGFLNILAISGWMGIFVSKGKSKDMIWPDQIWLWVIAYDLWNFAYTYNCVPDHSWYAGFILILASLIPFVLIKKGAWIQHRAFTLAFWMMFVMSFPSFVDTSEYAVKSSGNESALFLVSFIALLANVILVGYHFYRIMKYKINPFKEEVYVKTKAYQEVISENK